MKAQMKKALIKQDLKRIKQDIIKAMDELEEKGSSIGPSETFLLEKLEHFIVTSRSIKD